MVLPAPEGPMSAIMSPGRALNDTLSSRTFISLGCRDRGPRATSSTPRSRRAACRPTGRRSIPLGRSRPHRSSLLDLKRHRADVDFLAAANRDLLACGMRCPRTKVPFALPRSSTKSCPSTCLRKAWRLET